MNTEKKLNYTGKDINLRIKLPASKSISNRALILNALSYSPFDVENLSDCDDTRVMVAAFDSNISSFDVGAAGTSMRFLTAFLSKTVGEWTITGSERMKQRPIRILVDALNKLGGKVEYLENDGYPPLKIYGSAMMGGEIDLDGSISSQYISALMMIAPYMVNGLTINLKSKVISKPYIQMTLGMMQSFGVKAEFKDDKIDIRPQNYIPTRYRVESDWSSASYWYEILALSGKGNIKLIGLNENSLQGDRAVADIFENLGVETVFYENEVELSVSDQIRKVSDKFRYDFTNVPDLAQTVVVTCCLMKKPFHFSGLQSLKIKETNRVAALMYELRKLGYVLVEPQEGELMWDGTCCQADEIATIDTYEDHRMAMAFAPIALTHPLIIRNPEVVSKSYPLFWNDMSHIISDIL